MGTDGLLSGAQAPAGFYYSNIWSYYHASGSDFAETGPLKCGPLNRACLSLDLGGNGTLDEFVDQNVIVWTSKYKILGANNGLLVDVPFAIADVSGAASLEPVLSLNRASLALPSTQNSGGTTKGSITDIYVEPINLGWHFRQLDAIVSSGFFAPSGPYNANAKVNIGFGHWTGVFGLGASHMPTRNAPGHSRFMLITCCTARRWEEIIRLAMLSRWNGAPAKAST